MRKKFLPFTRSSIDHEEIKEVVDTLKSGWITSGPRTKKFEKEFAKFIGTKYAVALNSCTSALHLSLAAIGLKEGEEVIVPTMTFTSTAEVVTYFKAKPVFVDCEFNTLLIDVDKIEEKITTKTKAIIPVHFGGQPCDIDKILKIARKHNLKVIWDSAHAFPAKYKGNIIGTFPDLTCFSFYATKPLTTGEGGMVVTNNKEYAKKIRILSLHGINNDAWNRYSEKGTWYYEVIAPGFKYNLTDIAASLGIWQLKKTKKLWLKRKEIAGRYNDAFKGLNEIGPLFQKPRRENSWHLYVIKLNLENLKITRDQFIEKMKEKKIGTSVHFIPLHMHPYWKKTYNLKENDFPAASAVYKQIVSLPIFPDMKNNDIDYVISSVKDIIEKCRK